MIKKIAFIGLGNMGAPMAENLIEVGFDVSVFDVNKDAVNRLVGQGAKTADTVKECAEAVDLVVTMLPNAKIVLEVYEGEGGIFSASQKPKYAIDSSTIDVMSAKTLSKIACSYNVQLLDAPVSGGTGGAKAGTLTFMVGGEHKTLDVVKPVFEAMGKNIFHAGDAGAGQAAKICNNMLLAITMIGTSEALTMGQKYGLDASVLSEIMSKSSGSNWVLDVYNPVPNVMDGVPSSNNYEGGFLSALMLKDLKLSQKFAADVGVDTRLGKIVTELYQNLVDDGYDMKDFSSIYKKISE